MDFFTLRKDVFFFSSVASVLDCKVTENSAFFDGILLTPVSDMT